MRLAAPVERAGGGTLAPGGKGIINTAVLNPIVDAFRQYRFTDPETGLILDYNLYVPADYVASNRYPLVLFMHDAGVTGSNPRRTLQQGLGAISFASERDQAAHPSLVLAPQFPVPLVNDEAQRSVYVDMIPRLLDKVARDFSVDRGRIYATGQSGGCMTSIALAISDPELLAAVLCVAGQWDPAVVAPLAATPFWAIVSEDDAKAFPGMTAIMKVLEDNGAQVTRGSLDAKASPEAMDKAVQDILEKRTGGATFFTPFVAGSVLPEGGDAGPGAGHVNTWVHAYSIPAVRDWLFTHNR
ncbi:MAG: hypothetical protein KDJ74_02390 [Notoacmeibacter sp.]|nr:hypothetical protein [Notoacmeibacter sp.]